MTLVTFGFVNCNRLHYLKSCVESLLYTTRDYKEREFIVVDNASTEEGTDEYLADLKGRGFTVVKQSFRDPANEFARGLNVVKETAKGDFICPLQGDMQFILDYDWITSYVEMFKSNPDVGCATLDAQRYITNSGQSASMTFLGTFSKVPFLRNTARPPISGAGDVFYSKRVLDWIGPWRLSNQSHEGGNDSETAMLTHVRNLMAQTDVGFFCAQPVIPVAAAIYTDKRGTNARVRGDKRYGDYWAPHEGFKYYNLQSIDACQSLIEDQRLPISIEKIAQPIGWEQPLDSAGNWLKNPIRPETATENDYVILQSKSDESQKQEERSWEHVDSWLGGGE